MDFGCGINGLFGSLLVLRPIFRLATLYVLFRWLKPRWIIISVFILAMLMVSYIHSEYMSYVEATNDGTHLALSFKIKHGLNLIIILVFAISLKFAKPQSEHESTTLDNQKQYSPTTIDDGFDFLRGKKSLEGRAEKILQKTQSSKADRRI